MTSVPADRSTRHTAVVLLLSAAALLPTLAYRMGVDQGVFAYMGAELLRGRWPYVHTWESDYPGLVFLQAVEILALGKSVVAFRVFDLFVQLGNAYLILRIARRTCGWTAATVAPILFCLIYQGYGPWNTAQREGFGLLFVLAGFWLTLSSERRPAVVTAGLAGLGMGVAVLIKPTLLALSLFYLPLAPALRTRRALAVGLVSVAAVITPGAIVVAGYWSQGVLRELYDACVAYQAVYTARLRGDAPMAVYWLQKAARLGLNAVVLPLVYLPFLWIEPTARRERVMLWLGYAGATYAVFVQGTFAGYHYLPGLALGAIFVGSMLGIVFERLPGRAGLPARIGPWPARIVLVTVVMALASGVYLRRAPFDRLIALTFLGPPSPGEFRNQTVFDFTESYQTAAYLRARTEPGESIQVWGYESLVYYLADRPAASRFQMTHPLVMRMPDGSLTPMQLRWRDEFIRSVTTTPPAYVAVVRDDRWWWAPGERSSEELLDDFTEWKDVIARRYQLEQQIGRFLIYKRRVSG